MIDVMDSGRSNRETVTGFAVVALKPSAIAAEVGSICEMWKLFTVSMSR